MSSAKSNTSLEVESYLSHLPPYTIEDDNRQASHDVKLNQQDNRDPCTHSSASWSALSPFVPISSPRGRSKDRSGNKRRTTTRRVRKVRRTPTPAIFIPDPLQTKVHLETGGIAEARGNTGCLPKSNLASYETHAIATKEETMPFICTPEYTISFSDLFLDEDRHSTHRTVVCANDCVGGCGEKDRGQPNNKGDYIQSENLHGVTASYCVFDSHPLASLGHTRKPKFELV